MKIPRPNIFFFRPLQQYSLFDRSNNIPNKKIQVLNALNAYNLHIQYACSFSKIKLLAKKHKVKLVFSGIVSVSSNINKPCEAISNTPYAFEIKTSYMSYEKPEIGVSIK